VSHLAAAVGAPSVVLFTPALRAWRPWAPHARVLEVSTRRVIADEVDRVVAAARAAMAVDSTL
jgi:ADP-heptose:LPS heptosyltransferase